jgi:hypothetical protein
MMSGKETTEMLFLGTIEASPGIIRVFSVYFFQRLETMGLINPENSVKLHCVMMT